MLTRGPSNSPGCASETLPSLSSACGRKVEIMWFHLRHNQGRYGERVALWQAGSHGHLSSCASTDLYPPPHPPSPSQDLVFIKDQCNGIPKEVSLDTARSCGYLGFWSKARWFTAWKAWKHSPTLPSCHFLYKVLSAYVTPPPPP